MSGVIVIKNGTALPYRLKKGKKTFTINPTAVVKAAVSSVDKSVAYIAAVVQLDTADGADWANSLVVVEFSVNDTDISETLIGDAILQIQVADPVPKTWFFPVEITKDNIS